MKMGGFSLKKFIALILVCILGFTLTSCSSTTGKLAKIQKAGQIVVYTDPNFPPFEFQGANGIEGVDIEIANAIAQSLGVTATIQQTDFDAILMALKGGKGDIGVSGFSITPERQQSVDFSDPYIDSVQYLILPADSSVKVMEDLAGKTVGVALGYTGDGIMQDALLDPNPDTGSTGVLFGTNTTVKEYNSAMDATLDLQAGRIDAVVMDEYVSKNIVSQNAGLQAIELAYADGSVADDESYGVMIPKGNQDLVDKINAVIAQLNASGQIQQWMIQYAQESQAQ